MSEETKKAEQIEKALEQTEQIETQQPLADESLDKVSSGTLIQHLEVNIKNS